jgi:predicted SAM-dependent methyltransferase
MRYLNLGCGDRFHPEWENVDMYPYAPTVRLHDLTKKLPYRDGEFEAVYHSHVLEHFPRKLGFTFIQECHRLLKPGGVIRVAVPDLEQIARLYLESLEKASNELPGWSDKYDWMVIEMLDQCVREETCGALIEYFNRDPIPNWDFIQKRWGVFAVSALKNLQANRTQRNGMPPSHRKAWGYILRHPRAVFRNKLLKLLLGPNELEALEVARFRRSGEIHLWMYDSFSLARLLEQAGFTNSQRVSASESRLPGWANFCLDTEPDGRVYKADSLYMEAIKP